MSKRKFLKKSWLPDCIAGGKIDNEVLCKFDHTLNGDWYFCPSCGKRLRH